MNEKSDIHTANLLRNVARVTLLLIGIIVFLFALVSGSEEYGGGINGIIKNSPNALPWLIIIVMTAVAWYKEQIGGVFITVFGIFLVYFFNFSGPNFWYSTLLLTMIIPTMGLFLIASWYLRKGSE